MIEKFSTPESESRRNEQYDIEQGLADYKAAKDGTEESPKEQELREAIEKNLINSQDFFEQEGYASVDEIYDWYEKAMVRRNREALSRDSFISHFFENLSDEATYMFGDKEKGFLLGILKADVFVPTHFAPRTLRSGYELMSNLGEGELPAALAITEDLAETLKKMPSWKVEDVRIPAYFRDQVTEKMIAHNHHPQVQKLMTALLADYLGATEKEAGEILENHKNVA